MAGTLRSATGIKDSKFAHKKIGIVVSEWNAEITDALYEGARSALLASGIRKKNIHVSLVPGSFELPLAAQRLAKQKEIDGVVALGCVIKGDTPHFEFICQAVSQGIMTVNLNSGKPVAFGVLTTLNKSQALERAGGKLGNKGEEAAETVLRMLLVKKGK